MRIKLIVEWAKKYKVDLMSWSAFIIWESMVIGLSVGKFGHPITYLVHYLLIILLFYAHALVVWPFALSKSKHYIWLIPALTAIEIAVFILLSYGFDKLLIASGVLNEPAGFTLTIPYIMRTIYRGLYFLGFSTGFYYLGKFVREKKRSLELEKQNFEEIIKRRIVEEERTQAQNAFLMAQINPHFFFNTLDYLYHNIVDQSPRTGEAIEALASMMRFAIDADSIGSYILLRDEIEQVENLIYLHQLRKPMFIKLSIDELVKDISLIPLILLTLVENVYKHGNLSEEKEFAEIRITLDDEQLSIETNNLINYRQFSERKSTGLLNISRRLKNAYGDKVILDYGVKKSNYFNVRILIPVYVLTNAWTFSNPLKDIDKV